MANFSYHPPTRNHCSVCEELAQKKVGPLIDKLNGKASSAANFPVHNWYHFVLGYTPDFPRLMLERESLSSDHLVVDPFMGSGTTLVACKHKEIPSAGIDANDYFVDVVRTKTSWEIDTEKARECRDEILSYVGEQFSQYRSTNAASDQEQLFTSGKYTWEEYAETHRPEMLTQRYMSDIPFAKLHMIKHRVSQTVKEPELSRFFNLAVSSIVVPLSNVRYGPGFGVAKAKVDVDVLGVFRDKIDRMIEDISAIGEDQMNTYVGVKHGDSRDIAEYFSPDSVDLMVTSPPYPGDHEYTKHTRLELIFMGYATDIQQFRTIKKRMIRGSTTNIYKEDRDVEVVKHFESIQRAVELIDERLESDGATSGFEKLYTKLVWEYFGGMYKMLVEAHTVLREGGKISLLVSDSHAFKMVHILTAEILAEIGLDIGYKNVEIELWQDKISTSHKYHLRENIVTMTV